MSKVHTPVLLKEVIAYLNLASGKKIIDATLDGGGHSRAILEGCPGVAVLGIEWDPVEFKEFQSQNADLKMTAVNDSYTNLEKIVAEHNFKPDGILFDLGMSSWHLEQSGRGFSFLRDEKLDMRFNPSPPAGGPTAADIINTTDEKELERILTVYGEEQFAPQIARGIIKARQQKPIVMTGELVAVIFANVPFWYTKQKIHCATKTFQALRMAVNHELENIRQGLTAAIEVLAPGGRLAVISFHGLEDKTVRTIFTQAAKDKQIIWVTKETIKPKWEEVKQNPRSRSAKMKIVEKLP